MNKNNLYRTDMAAITRSWTRELKNIFLKANGLLNNLSLLGMVGVSAIFGAREASAASVAWGSYTDIVPTIAPEWSIYAGQPISSVVYNSSSTVSAPNNFSAIYMVVDNGTHNPVGGFDVRNGYVTSASFNSLSTYYGLTEGDTANTPEGANPQNAFSGYWTVFYDSNNDGSMGTFLADDAYGEFAGFLAGTQLEDTEFSIIDFTPFNPNTPGTFTFTTTKSGPAPWNSVSDIVPQTIGESINYTSSNSLILPNRLTAICYVSDGGVLNPIGGFDLLNGVVTKAYFNKDYNSVTGYGLNNGDTANTGSNPGNNPITLPISYEVFYDRDGSGDFNAPYEGYIANRTEQLSPSTFQISGFSPYGSQNPGTFTFALNLPGPTNSVLTTLSMSALGGGTNQVTFSVAVSNAVSFTINYKNSLTNTTWETLGAYSKTGAVTVITDTNNLPQRFYRVITP